MNFGPLSSPEESESHSVHMKWSQRGVEVNIRGPRSTLAVANQRSDCPRRSYASTIRLTSIAGFGLQ